MQIGINASVEVHKELNPRIWNADNTLREDVSQTLNEVVDEFAETVDLPLTILDAHIVGSNASYNYTEDSDLDLHLIVNFSSLDADPTIVQAWMWTQKKLFNDDYDISIRGIRVEIYVEDVGTVTMSNGIYSLFNKEWIKFPEPVVVEVDDKEVDQQVDALVPEIQEVLESQESSAEVENMIDNLYLIRKNGLATDGEYGVGNQVFKEIRSLGYLDQLKDLLLELKSEELSI